MAMAEARLLLVEDEDDLRMLVGEALRLLGFSVASVCDGVAAVVALEQERFDVVVSDVSMPNGMSGIDLAGHAARLQPHARIILASGYARAQLPPLPDNVVFLPKPYRIAQLAELLRERQPVSG
jgi:two-component system cell cycle response regulator CpdR